MRSVVLNVAEGGAERAPGAKRRYYGIARASLWEVAAAVDLAQLERHIEETNDIAERLREVDAILGSLTRK